MYIVFFLAQIYCKKVKYFIISNYFLCNVYLILWCFLKLIIIESANNYLYLIYARNIKIWIDKRRAPNSFFRGLHYLTKPIFHEMPKVTNIGKYKHRNMTPDNGFANCSEILSELSRDISNECTVMVKKPQYV